MFSKIEITGKITVKTGMHIGASDGFTAIGAIDSHVAKDSYSKLPYIPGSSLKGKMRSLLAKSLNKENEIIKTRDDDDERIKRLFGCSKTGENGYPLMSRLIFSDMIMSNAEELNSKNIQETEIKEENRISPLTSIADPRQIERVVRGAEFPLNLIYNVVKEDEIKEDMKLLAEGIKLMNYDYIGGSGSRGYGKIEITVSSVDCVIGETEGSVIDEVAKLLGVE